MIKISLDTFYNLIYLPGLAAIATAYHYWLYKYNCSKVRCVIYVLLTIIVGFIGAEAGGPFYNWVMSLRGTYGTFNRSIFGAIAFVLTIVPLCFLIEKTIRRILIKREVIFRKDISLRETLDMLQPAAMILFITVKARCLFVGCCYGIPCSWGPYSWIIKTNVFPVQILDLAVEFIIMWISYKYIHSRSFRRGTALFFSLGAFCSARFFLEFLMYYKEEERNFLGFLTLWQCVSIIFVAICLTVIIIQYRLYPPEPRPKTVEQARRREERRSNRKKKNGKR